MVRTNKGATKEQLREWGLLDKGQSQEQEENTFDTTVPDVPEVEDEDTNYYLGDLVEPENFYCASQSIADLLIDSENEEDEQRDAEQECEQDVGQAIAMKEASKSKKG